MFARRPSISRRLLRDVALIALLLFTATCSGDTTNSFAGPSQLVFKIDPGSATAGATLAPSIVVEAHDANGNLVKDFTGTIALTIVTNPGGGTLSGTTSLNAIGGVATFSSLSINKSGTGYRLQASAGTLTARSALFDITAGPAAKLAFSNVPTSFSAGTPFSITVSAFDALDNVATTFTGQVTLVLNATGGAILSGTTTLTANAGVANFVNLTIDKMGAGFSFGATGGGLAAGTSTSFRVNPGPPTLLVITTQPTTTVAGANITPAVVVTVRDNMGNTATTFTGSVALAITSGTGSAGATLGGTNSVAALGGVATFPGLHIAKAGTAYTLSATAAGLTGATSGPFNLTVGPATQLAYLVSPSTSFAGASITPAIQVGAEDGSGNVVSSFTGSIAIAIGTNPANGTLSGTTAVVAAVGIATFPNLSLDKAGTGYTLAASTSGLTGITSDAFNIRSGAGTRVVFAAQPLASVVAGVAISPAIQVAVRDTNGNSATDFNGPVTIAIANNPTGGTLSGTTTVSAVAGVATFADLKIDKVGTGYTLSASASVLTPALSTAFDVVAGAVSGLVYTQQPFNATAGAGISPAIKIAAVDGGGNPVNSFTGRVTITLTTGTGNPAATLSGTNAVSAVAGVATFAGLSIDKVGSGYTLDAQSAGLTGITSNAFNIAAGAATKLVFTNQPTTAAGGATIAPAVTVTALDAQQNIATGFNGNIAMSITGGTGTGGAILSGVLSVATVSGVASFSTLSIDKSGAGYSLTAASGGLTTATSTAFDIVVGAAARLSFTVQPTNLITGGVITPAVQVTARDAGANTVPSFTNAVTITIGTNAGGGSLTGTTSVGAVAGVASFSTLSINKSGTGYTLAAAATGLTGATSTAFNVTACPATHLSFTVQPTTGPAGVAITPAVRVTALDCLNNVATSFTGNITVAIGTNPSAGQLSGTTIVAATAGVASFSTLKIDKIGTGYTLMASATSLTAATSAPFDVLVDVVTKLAFSVQPVAATAGVAITPAMQVTAQDVLGNTVPTFVGNITLAIKSGTGTSGALLRGTVSVGAVAGVATFSTVNIDKAGTGYVLNASSTGLTGVSSTAFNITAAPAVRLAYTVAPGLQTAGTSFTPTVKVAALDSLGNIVTSFTNNILVAIGTNPSGGVLGGTLSVKASAGVSSFSNLTINKAGVGYTLVASSVGLLSATSLPFTVNPGPATQLSFSTQPVSTAPLATMPPVAVSALDAQGNVATGLTSNVTVAIGTNPATPTPGILSGTLTVKAVAGVATFSTLSIDQVATGYTLTAASTGLTGATSAPFDITNGSKLVFTVQPTAANAGAMITPAVQVTAKDALNNTLPTFTGNVTLSIRGGTGTAGAVLSGTTTVAAVAGVATFSNLSINLGGTGYQLIAASSGLTSATSNTFTITSTVGANMGQWSAVLPAPIVQVHQHLLTDGRVLSYGENGSPQVWDPGTGIFTAVPSPSLVFCGGHNFLSDGRLLTTGGGTGNGLGLVNSNIFDPGTASWITGPNMAQGRWYPTNTTMPDGEVVTISGQDQTGTNVPIPEIGNGTSWRQLTGASLGLPNYPRDFVAPDGRLFDAGSQTQSSWLDVTGVGSWTTGPSMKFGSRAYGSAVMYEAGRILYAGGNSTPTNTAEIIDLNQSNPQWTYTGSMTYARWNLNATVLPDGQVLVTGGVNGNITDPSLAVNAAEMWNPATGLWTTMASSAPLLRGYHSTSLLLPDGRVISSGGGDGAGTPVNHNFEIYSPPYLFKGARPTVTGVTGTVGYGQTLLVQTPDGAGITKVTLIRFGSVTHAFDQGQRLVSLSFSQASGGISVTLPASRSDAPPGPYMLFLVNGNGVPSVARIMLLK